MSFICENLRRIRQHWGESQEVFANRFGLRRTAYAHVESGRNAISVQMLHELSILSGISMNDLLEREIGTKEILPLSQVGMVKEPEVVRESEGGGDKKSEGESQKELAELMEQVKAMAEKLEKVSERLVVVEKKVQDNERSF